MAATHSPTLSYTPSILPAPFHFLSHHSFGQARTAQSSLNIPVAVLPSFTHTFFLSPLLSDSSHPPSHFRPNYTLPSFAASVTRFLCLTVVIFTTNRSFLDDNAFRVVPFTTFSQSFPRLFLSSLSFLSQNRPIFQSTPLPLITPHLHALLDTVVEIQLSQRSRD